MKLYSEKETLIYDFIYGSQFNGLPDEIRNIIVNAIELTDPWYQLQQQKPKAKIIQKQ